MERRVSIVRTVCELRQLRQFAVNFDGFRLLINWLRGFNSLQLEQGFVGAGGGGLGGAPPGATTPPVSTSAIVVSEDSIG